MSIIRNFVNPDALRDAVVKAAVEWHNQVTTEYLADDERREADAELVKAVAAYLAAQYGGN